MSLDRSEGLVLVSWGEGPLAIWRAGIHVINAWQRVWLDNVSRTQGLFEAWPTASEKALAPWSDLADRWSERAGVLGLLGANPVAQPRTKVVASKAATVVAPAKPAADEASERKEVEAAIAAKQGRSLPRLGCLEGVEVVGGPVPSAVVVEPQVAVAEVAVPAPAPGSVTSMLAMQAKSLARAVRSPRQNEAAQPARKVAAKAASDAPTKGVKVAKTAVVAAAKAPVKVPAQKLAKPSAKARRAG